MRIEGGILLFVLMLTAAVAGAESPQGMYFAKKSYEPKPLPKFAEMKDRLPEPDLRREPALGENVLEILGVGVPQFPRAGGRLGLRLPVHRCGVQPEYLPVGHLFHDDVLQLRPSAGARHRLARQFLLQTIRGRRNRAGDRSHDGRLLRRLAQCAEETVLQRRGLEHRQDRTCRSSIAVEKPPTRRRM